MINDQKTFETGSFFSGGAGMFIQYHDVIKPVYLYAIVKMIITGNTFGLPVNIIQNMSLLSIVEWYTRRRYRNPLQQLDWAHKSDSQTLDDIMLNILTNDPTIYTLCPLLNMDRMFQVYRHQHMSFPIIIYSEHDEPTIKDDCKHILSGIPHKYIHGNLKEAISKCDQNFTYIFSDIELVKHATEILTGTYSHILLTKDYRYNYTDYYKTPKYDLQELMLQHPFTRLGSTIAIDIASLGHGLNTISTGGTQ